MQQFVWRPPKVWEASTAKLHGRMGCSSKILGSTAGICGPLRVPRPVSERAERQERCCPAAPHPSAGRLSHAPAAPLGGGVKGAAVHGGRHRLWRRAGQAVSGWSSLRRLGGGMKDLVWGIGV